MHVQEKLAKARRVLQGLQTAIAFFWATVWLRLASWQLSAEVETWLRDELLPAVHLERVAMKASAAAEHQLWMSSWILQAIGALPRLPGRREAGPILGQRRRLRFHRSASASGRVIRSFCMRKRNVLGFRPSSSAALPFPLILH
jgi:hypothetical protein